MKLCLKCFKKELALQDGDNVRVYKIELHCGYGLEEPVVCDRCGKHTDCYIEIDEVIRGEQSE